MSLQRKYVVIIGMLMVFSCAYSQQQEDVSPTFRAVKMFTHSDFKFSKNSSNFISLLRTFSPTITWGKEFGNFHEIGVQDINIQLSDYRKNYRGAIDYSYNVRITKGLNPDKKLKFYAGVGTQFSLQHDRNPAYSSNSFSNKSGVQSFRLQFIPRVTFQLSKNILLDVHIPYGLYSASRFSYTTEDPSLSTDDRKKVFSNSTTFPNEFTVRVGVAIKF